MFQLRVDHLKILSEFIILSVVSLYSDHELGLVFVVSLSVTAVFFYCFHTHRPESNLTEPFGSMSVCARRTTPTLMVMK